MTTGNTSNNYEANKLDVNKNVINFKGRERERETERKQAEKKRKKIYQKLLKYSQLLNLELICGLVTLPGPRFLRPLEILPEYKISGKVNLRGEANDIIVVFFKYFFKT